MSEKLCLQWNDFRKNVNSAFGKLRGDKEFTDVTLVCEDGQQMEAHKVILASSSPFFEKMLQKSKHPHPLIYLKGFHSKDFASIVDFLYFGEANVFQEDLDSFLAIAGEIRLKGLTNQTSSDLIQEHEETQHPEKNQKDRDLPTKSTALHHDLKRNVPNSASTIATISNQSITNLHALDEKVKSMMEKGQQMILIGKQANGTPLRATPFTCKVCGKEGQRPHIRAHIEANHMEGIGIQCDICEKTSSSREGLRFHKRRFHK